MTDTPARVLLPAEATDKWEYIRAEYTGGATIEVLNEFGAQGWELCERWYAYHTFKRRIAAPNAGAVSKEELEKMRVAFWQAWNGATSGVGQDDIALRAALSSIGLKVEGS